MLQPEQIIYEDNHLLVVNKPAGIVSQGASSEEISLIDKAKHYLKKKYNKPGNVYLGIVSRLDKLTTGVIVMARTSKAAARLSDAFKNRQISKTYQALVERAELPVSHTLTDFLRKNDAARKMEVCKPEAKNAKKAVLHFQLVNQCKSVSHLKINLETGRKHQIRIQLSNYGSPILGDRKYGSCIDLPRSIALHSATLSLQHPTTKEKLTFKAPLPSGWKSWMQ